MGYTLSKCMGQCMQNNRYLNASNSVCFFWTFKFYDLSRIKIRKFHDLYVPNLAHAKNPWLEHRNISLPKYLIWYWARMSLLYGIFLFSITFVILKISIKSVIQIPLFFQVLHEPWTNVWASSLPLEQLLVVQSHSMQLIKGKLK